MQQGDVRQNIGRYAAGAEHRRMCGISRASEDVQQEQNIKGWAEGTGQYGDSQKKTGQQGKGSRSMTTWRWAAVHQRRVPAGFF